MYHWKTIRSAYDAILGERRDDYALDAQPKAFSGDPARAADRLLELVDGPHPPLRILLGNRAVDIAAKVHASALENLAEWEEVSRSVDVDIGDASEVAGEDPT